MDWASLYSTSPPSSSSGRPTKTTLPSTSPSERMGATVSRQNLSSPVHRGKKVSLLQKKDPSVVAGLRVELEGKLLDGTVQSRLSGLSRKLDEIIV